MVTIRQKFQKESFGKFKKYVGEIYEKFKEDFGKNRMFLVEKNFYEILINFEIFL